MTAPTSCLSPRTLALGLLAGGVVLLAADPALAQAVGGGGSLETFLSNIVNIITGVCVSPRWWVDGLA